MTSAELLTPEPIGNGSRFQAEMQAMRRNIDMTVEFTKFERPRLLGSTSQSLTLSAKSRLREPAQRLLTTEAEPPGTPDHVRISVQIVFTTSSKTVGARNMRPAPTAHHDSSPSSVTSA